jgi:hypothetical protein
MASNTKLGECALGDVSDWQAHALVTAAFRERCGFSSHPDLDPQAVLACAVGSIPVEVPRRHRY